jgi:hypothetical protein
LSTSLYPSGHGSLSLWSESAAALVVSGLPSSSPKLPSSSATVTATPESVGESKMYVVNFGPIGSVDDPYFTVRASIGSSVLHSTAVGSPSSSVSRMSVTASPAPADATPTVPSAATAFRRDISKLSGMSWYPVVATRSNPILLVNCNILRITTD